MEISKKTNIDNLKIVNNIINNLDKNIVNELVKKKSKKIKKNESLINTLHKKKKKHNKRSIQFSTGNIDEKTFENSNEFGYETVDAHLENSFDVAKVNFKTTPKKMTKPDKSKSLKEFTISNTEEETFENAIGEFNANINDYDSNECGIGKNKYSSNEIKDTSSKNNFTTNNKNDEMKTPKRKKKHDKSLSLKEFSNTEELTFENSIGKLNENINGYKSNESRIGKNKYSSNELKDTSSKNNFTINNKNYETKTHKKKKKHNKSLSLKEFTISNTEEETFENANINDYDSNECGIGKNKYSSNEIKDTSSKNNFTTNNKNDEVKTPKKKKKHDRSLSLKEFTISNTEEETFENAIGELNANINDYDSNECGIGKNKYSSNEIKDTSSKNNFTTNNKNDDLKTPKKKKKHDKSLSLKEFTISNTEEETFENAIGELNANINDYDSNECGIGKNKYSSNEIKDTSSKNNFTTNNKNDEVKTPKKKKKHDRSLSLKEFTISNTEEETFENAIGELNANINDYDSNECGIGKNKYSSNEIKDTSSKNNFTTNNKNDEVKTPKKKKKHDRSLSLKEFTISNTEEETFENAIGELNANINDYDSNECGIGKNKYSSNEIKDTSSKNNFTTNNKNDEVKTPKMKKKHDKSLSLKEFTISNTEEETFENAIGELNANINDYDSNECGIGINKYSSNEIKDTSSKNNFTTNNKNDEVKTPKKKKKHDRSLSLKEFTISNTEEETFENAIGELNANINDYDSNECGIGKNKYSSNEIKDTSSKNNFTTNNKNDEVKTPKKKKKHDRSLSLKEFTISNTEEETFENAIGELNANINDYDSNECGIGKNKYSSNEIKDTSSKNNFTTNNKNDEVKTPKMKKKHDKSLSLKEFTISNTEEETFENAIGEFNTNINDYDSNECGIEKKKYSSNVITDTSSKNIDDFSISMPKKIKEHNLSLHSIELTTNNSTEDKTLEIKLEESIDNISECDSKKSVSRKRKYNTISNELADQQLENNNFEITSPIKKKYNKSSNSIENIIEPGILNYDKYFFEEDNKLVTLQNILCESENIIDETKVNMKDFDLINYLIKSQYSLINDNKTISKKLSYEIKNAINEKCQMVTQSDVVLLKAIGKSILERIIEKQNSAMSIDGLHIKIPLESQKNQIHYVETALSNQPNKSIMDSIKKLYPFVKLGVFNEEEDDIIKKYWSKFQQEYKIFDVQPFLSNGLQMELPLSERLNFFRYISTELPNRLLFSVHKRFNLLFSNQKDKLSFNSKEDQVIMKVENCDAIKNKYKVLSFVLNRSRLQIYRRVNTLKMQPYRKETIVWDNCKRQELFTNILLETNTKNWKDLKNMIIKKKTWIKISERCGKPINYEKAKTQWKFLSTMLFCEQSIKLSTLRLNILKLLLEIQPKFWSDLNWIEITNKLYPGANSKVINTFFHWWVYYKVPSETRKSVKETLLYLSKHVMNDETKYIVNGDDDPEYPMLTVDDNNLLIKI